MKKYWPWLILSGCLIWLAIFYASAQVQLAGDIVEYFGVSESLLNHQGFNLSPSDQANLEKNLHPAYFTNPGYYVTGANGQRYPVHFIFYSILLIPARLILRSFGQNELLALAITNLMIVGAGLTTIFKFFVKPLSRRLILLAAFFLSPLAFFLSWPGPDIYYLVLLLIAIYCFSRQRFFLASLLTALGSWHSQPLVILAGFFWLAGLIHQPLWRPIKIKPLFKTLILSLILGIIVAIPYSYNFWAFGVITPWTVLQDGWTQITGFGMQNLSLTRLFEQFFDLNTGIFWYAPIYLIIGLIYFCQIVNHRRSLFSIGMVIIITAFGYQTNPAWHFGTAGYGPSRHIIFILPFLIFAITKIIRQNFASSALIGALIFTQLVILPLNNWYLPNFENTLYHNALAVLVLEKYPQFYQPTPEIFVDRTNHTDSNIITSAIFTDHQGKCLKGYLLPTDLTEIEHYCGPIEPNIRIKLEDQFTRKASYPREIITTEATLWPDSASCEKWYHQDNLHPYRCLETIDEVKQISSLTDLSRIKNHQNTTGVWRIETGLPFKLTVPPGYIIDYHSLSGQYVTFTKNH